MKNQYLEIKAIALDIFGTVIAYDKSYCSNTDFPPRRGLREFFDKCDKKGIKVISTSDCCVPKIKADLRNCFRKNSDCKMSLERFYEFFQLDESPKDFSRVYISLEIDSSELLVIGDSWKDIEGAKKHNCQFIACPEYLTYIKDNFSFFDIPV